MIRKEKSLSIREYSGNSKKRRYQRPKSEVRVGKIKNSKIKLNNNNIYNQIPPIIYTMPNNKKMLSGMGNNIEREQLYENNILLKESVNKLKRQLAESKYNVVKREIELREKEKIIRDCIKENDLESGLDITIEKAKESALLTLCKEKYNTLKSNYEKEIEENKILRANIKITKIKEFQIENDILHKELAKIKQLYGNCKKNLKRYKKIVKELTGFRDRFSEQHKIITSYAEKCDILNAEIRNLKDERDILLKDLDMNMKKQEKLKLSNDKLKIKNIKFLNQKKIKEEFNFRHTDNEKNMIKLKKEVNELKRAFNQKNADYHELKKTCDTYQKKLNSFDEKILKPFQYKNIKHIEQETNPKNMDKVILYKSLYDESNLKNAIYERCFKEKNINPVDIIKEYGYFGVLNSDNRLMLLNNNDKSHSINNSKIILKKEKQNENEKEKESIKKDNDEENIKIDNFILDDENENDNKNKKQDEEAITINNNNTTNKKEKEKDNKNINNSVNGNMNNQKENNKLENFSEERKTKLSEDTNDNTHKKANTTNNNNIIGNDNDTNDENEKGEIDFEGRDNEFLTLIHLFLKNFEANHITTEILQNKMKNIFESFTGKTESSKEEFLLPFNNLFIELMNVTEESDKQIIQKFFDDYIEYLKGNTSDFFNELSVIFENVIDYSSMENNENLLNYLALNIQKYKTDLEKKLKEEDKKGDYIITFDIFKKIINDLNIVLEDEVIEFLLYKMKSSVPKNHSINDLNCKIIFELLNRETNEIHEEDKKSKENEDEEENDELSKKISDKLSDFKNTISNENKDLEIVCKDKVKTFDDKEKKIEVIEKKDFFEIMEKYGVICDEEIKETIYKLFINDNPLCTDNGNIMMMDFTKLKNLFLNDYYSE